MELQLDEEESSRGKADENDEEVEPTASFEIDLNDSEIDVGRKRNSRFASTIPVAPPMSSESPSSSPIRASKTSTSSKTPRGKHNENC